MSESSRPEPPEGGPGLSRRDFVKTLGSAAVAASVPWTGTREASGATTGPGPAATAETPVARFFRSLSNDQRKLLCFPSNHPLRSQVQNHWAIVEPTIDDLTPDQQALCREIFRNLVSEDGHARFQKQMQEDDGGFERYHVAVFGEPGSDRPFEWVVTGRHATLRADGHRAGGAAFGGPIFYGHAANVPRDDARRISNVWWYQAEQAMEIFKTLDARQKARALVSAADEPRSARLRRDGPIKPGLAVGDLDGQQKPMVLKLLTDMLGVFRVADVNEEQNGLRDARTLRLSYFKGGDHGDDGLRKVWKLEAPGFSWFFHGSPHVHSWLNIARKPFVG